MFDRYIMVDWSSTDGPSPLKPSKDAVWVGRSTASGESSESYFRTRSECIASLRSELGASKARVLIGFDFPYGYPRGFAAALALSGNAPPWQLTWNELRRRINDDAKNRNNRFRVAADLNLLLTPPNTPHGPFWGRPETLELPAVSDKRQYDAKAGFLTHRGVTLPYHRLTEDRLPKAHSPWKLFTAGSVGGQALVGIPSVGALVSAFKDESTVWPFQTGFTSMPGADGARIVHAEIWPGVIEDTYPLLIASRERDRLRARLKKKRRTLAPSERAAAEQRIAERDKQLGDLITDRLQVRYMCEWARTEDGAGRLGQYFAVPHGLTDRQAAACVAEEGWVLGAR